MFSITHTAGTVSSAARFLIAIRPIVGTPLIRSIIQKGTSFYKSLNYGIQQTLTVHRILFLRPDN